MNSPKIIPTFLTITLIILSTHAQNSKPNSPFETVNNFCLVKRLSVERAFCLRVLKSPFAANTKSDDFTPLLNVAINSTSIFVCKTISRLQDMIENKNTRPSFMPVIQDCLSAYENTAAYFTNVITDASQESAIVGLDGEVIADHIEFCVRALGNDKHSEIYDSNNEVKNYAKLLMDIADSLGTNNKPK